MSSEKGGHFVAASTSEVGLPNLYRVNGAVTQAYRPYQLLSAPYQSPLYKNRRQDVRQWLTAGLLLLALPTYM